MTIAEAASCPVHRNFDPLAEDYLADPYPIMSAARDEAPVFFSPEVDMWVVTRYDDLEAIFKDPATYSAATAQRPVFPLTAKAQTILEEGFRATPVMSDCDPPKHTRLRAHNMKGFSARRIAALEPKVQAKAVEVLDAITPGRVDLVSALTYPLPAYMIFTFIGFPDQDMDMIKQWCGKRIAFSWGRPSPEEQVEVADNMVHYWRYVERFVAERVRQPQEDFTSDLIRIHLADPDALSLQEITNIAYGLSFAGHETTTNFTSNAIRCLLTHPRQWQELCADRSLIANAVEEVLRYDSSIIAWRRITTRPVTIGGTDLPTGSKLMLLLGAADRDPNLFPEPDVFDINRPNARAHLAFGKGIHFCLGASLARMEAKIVLEQLAVRAPGLTIAEDQEFTFPANISFRGPKQLWVNWQVPF
jgi:cytochrome P450